MVKFGTARTVSEYSGGEAGYLGISMAASLDSHPTGKLVIAIPKDGCTAWADIPTGVAASSLSLGQKWGLYKSATSGPISFVTTGYTSAASYCVSIVGPVNSADSTVEVAFIQDGAQFYSTASTAVA